MVLNAKKTQTLCNVSAYYPVFIIYSSNKMVSVAPYVLRTISGARNTSVTNSRNVSVTTVWCALPGPALMLFLN